LYMAMSYPVGCLADRAGRPGVLLAGYASLLLLYPLLHLSSAAGAPAIAACLFLLGFHYAATEGVLTAIAGGVIAQERRAWGLAKLSTWVSGGKLLSSLLFGWLWQRFGAGMALAVSAQVLLAGLAAAWFLLGRRDVRSA